MPLDGSEFKFEIDETTKLLIAARERIERGWCQGSMRKRGQVCFIGALRDVGGNSHDVWNYAARAIGVELQIGMEGDLVPIRDWNDTPGRTKEEVIAAFNRAISASLSGSA